jgi:hypothetical protein
MALDSTNGCPWRDVLALRKKDGHRSSREITIWKTEGLTHRLGKASGHGKCQTPVNYRVQRTELADTVAPAYWKCTLYAI